MILILIFFLFLSSHDLPFYLSYFSHNGVVRFWRSLRESYSERGGPFVRTMVCVVFLVVFFASFFLGF